MDFSGLPRFSYSLRKLNVLSQEIVHGSSKQTGGNVMLDTFLKEFETLNKTSYHMLLQQVRKTIGNDCSDEVVMEGCMEVLLVMLDVRHNSSQPDRDSALKEYFVVDNITPLKDITFKYLNILNLEALKKLRIKMLEAYSCNAKEFGHNLSFTPTTKHKHNNDIFPLSGIVKESNFEEKNSETSIEEMFDLLTMRLLEGTHVEFEYGELRRVVVDLVTANKSKDEVKQKIKEICGEGVDGVVDDMITNISKICRGTKNKSQPAPQYGRQVTVQTASQVEAMKNVRRHEKKMMRKGCGDDDEDSQNLHFQSLKLKREAQLASKKPLYQGVARVVPEEPHYPFVFDALKKSTATAGFIAGSKLMLPEGAIRSDNEKYEKVQLTAATSTRSKSLDNLVLCSELDDVSQRVFVGMKRLNLIQSIVYQAASFSNENLLICAPTGAGKTNIAMLTVLREVKRNMEEGVIKKDDFKIVYIAPMKALAAEIVSNFGGRLSLLGMQVKELTGDMQLSRNEIAKTQLIVTTPEKWDVITRKNTGDGSVSRLVKLLIIDEIHLLHDDRGSVIESIVSRTLRQVETSQTMIRIVGLSATLPNYLDVARFLRVNPHSGLFFFDESFRPVPLNKTFIGVKSPHFRKQVADMNEVAYDEMIFQVKQGHQVMVFVHARNETARSAEAFIEMAEGKGHLDMFMLQEGGKKMEAEKIVSRCSSGQLRKYFLKGFAIHHAGMIRPDRKNVERSFAGGLLKVIVCTSTLAWGVNLPAHAVVIKGTQIYDVKKGQFTNIGILDVLQIFGRAGRPQYDTFGHGTIITTQDKLAHYLSLLTQQNPIESQFIADLPNHLNAEISLGNVTNVEEAVQWLKYTYMFVRMRINPLNYGLTPAILLEKSIEGHLESLVVVSGRALDKARMIRYDAATTSFHPTDLGRTSSHFYIKCDTIEVVNEMFNCSLNVDKILEMLSMSKEFEQVKTRDEESQELDECLNENCQVAVYGGVENSHGKVNILLQTYISRAIIKGFSLISDQAYVVDNASRILRALFEMALHKGWPLVASRLLRLCKMVENRLWWWQSPLRQFAQLPMDVVVKVEQKGLSLDKINEMDAKEIGLMLRNVRTGGLLSRCASQIPLLHMEAVLQPITRTILRITITLTPQFEWNDTVHGKVSEPFWLWIEDPITDHIYHSDYVVLLKKSVMTKTPQTLTFSIPIFEPLPSQYLAKVVSDRWLGAEATFPISFKHLILPDRHPPHTELLDLQPLPKTALRQPLMESLYSFTHFNPIQSQIFHSLYHHDANVLLGAPTGSGKTVAAELAIFRMFLKYPGSKAVYIAPLKALVRERVEDWKVRIQGKLGKKVIELTGDVSPDMRLVLQADLIVTTPEKWDGLSRSWQSRSYVKQVALIVIDEIHLLGDERGPVLEVIVSRANFISAHTNHKVRIVGLSTALANAHDLANWLNIKTMGLFNFRPAVRPVPLEVHISGYPGKFYCPRMSSMNKPAFQAIKMYSPTKPSLIFVSSRRQTRLTALDLIAFLAAEDNPKQWLHISDQDITSITSSVRESTLKLTLSFGIGIHHAGLHEVDRKVVEELFVNQKIQVIICTSTLAWGVNFPAHLVVVKGTEFFDGKLKRYVDFPITDILQMMGRAGRPQFDDQGVAAILVDDKKKHFYKKFLYEPFPVESSLLGVISEHMNAELVAGTIATKQEAIDYITWTFFFRRLLINPSYYDLEEVSVEHINKYLSKLVEKTVSDLVSSRCVVVEEDSVTLSSTFEGRICSYYYLSHLTLLHLHHDLSARASIPDLIHVLSECHEFSTLPVRHNEDSINKDLSSKLPLPVHRGNFESSNTKTFLLLQAYFTNLPLPSTDYNTDTKSVLDQAMRVLQAMLDYSAERDWLGVCVRVVMVVQMVIQGAWTQHNPLTTLPHSSPQLLPYFRKPVSRHNTLICSKERLTSLAELSLYVNNDISVLQLMMDTKLDASQIREMFKHVSNFPIVRVVVGVRRVTEKQEEAITLFPRDVGKEEYTEVTRCEEYLMMVEATRLNRSLSKNGEVQTGRFPKQKQEGWVCVLGETRTDQVVALKRVGYFPRKKSIPLTFVAPDMPGRYVYTLYFMSDSYIDLDQQFDIFLQVI